ANTVEGRPGSVTGSFAFSFAPQTQGTRAPLTGDNRTQYRNERDRLLNILKNSDSCKAFLKDKLGLSASRIANAVRGQRAFDGTASTISTEAAGIQSSKGLFAGMSVQQFFETLTPDAAAAVYASGRGSTPRDVYYAPSGLNAATILHETLHTFYGSTYPDDKSLATKLGVSDEDFNREGSRSINTALRNAGCG
ncbi:MAG TPA: hypothetical protein VGV59_14855, partial [Pyrinomonadaceae bacterium]|nr:hypothetical protein [Pyrinomonadaceae bacterium]